MTKYTSKDVERFWGKVKIGNPDECWIWIACTDPYGYGHFSLNRKGLLAHRVAYEFTNGEIPEGMVVCHHCDNPPCCNPSHYFIGTRGDNNRDSVQKGRARKVGVRGEARKDAKLNNDKVQKIRQLYRDGLMKIPKLSITYGVSKSMIHSIIHRYRWKHIP